ncbi:hypothetical protein PHYSODRAFT_478476 [Phytophthora sojae]|uniref:Uncharacterized protein n=1 Tax=Phytophthora sojae (strain P6497) TaxID=1094619 RepID=G4YTM8_PHYSP|nr:hypothetical protein PHYSODRAFT_478476 [Phytophthora sojae]EGZ24256.1 hypothetical protein PHYSODRAFT_478476 [Phytophthora sojae]|eukprot:XP_009519544.1 hypothetical protein PHYSODRAFT_478476 [Phytophthora sojae]
MATLEATGALEELLRQQRSLVDQTLFPLLEDAPLGGLLQLFQSTLLALQSQEPSFWQLQVVKFIRNVLKTRVGGCVRDAVRSAASEEPQDPVQVVASAKAHVEKSSELEGALRQLRSDVEQEVARLTRLLSAEKENKRGFEGTDEHFLDQFWDKLQKLADSREMQPKSDEEREAERAEESESCSFEVLTFDDDLDDVSRSAMSVIFDLMSQIEDAAQFLELYGAVLEFMGLQLNSDKLNLDRQSLFESADAHSIAVLDCFRVLHALICRVTRHWVYFSADALARVMFSTFDLLTMYSKTETEVEAKRANPLLMMALIDDCPMQWVRLWLLNCPSARQLFVAMEESGFIADLLQYMSRVRPLALIKSTTSATDVIEKRAVQSEQHEELDADYEYLGSGVIDALILSITSVIVTIPRHSQTIVKDSYDDLWTKAISNSVATYLHAACGGDLTAGLVMTFRIAQEVGLVSELWEVAINSPEHECPPQLTHLVRRLRLLQCCLSTQYASSSLLLNECGLLVEFLSRALTRHVKGECMRSCDAEDTCCVAFSLVLSLVSSVPALLECSGLIAELKLLNLDAKSVQQRDVLCGDSEILGSCSLLEKQLCYEFEFVGGAGERIPRCELCAFDGYSRQNGSTAANVKESEVKHASEFIVTLRDKILQAIHDGVKSGSSVPMDFVLISQASWEMVNELESKLVVSTTSGTSRSAAAFTEVFAKLVYSLVPSNRSRLDVSNIGALDGNTGVYSGQDAAEFFPTDSGRKLMNRLYKNYTSGLSLESSPTLLHCIVKKFGKAAMDCFPVTVLMILYPTYDEADILRFLSHCLTTPSGCFLWPRSAAKRGNEADGVNEVSPAMLIAEGVELILEREFPLVGLHYTVNTDEVFPTYYRLFLSRDRFCEPSIDATARF